MMIIRNIIFCLIIWGFAIAAKSQNYEYVTIPSGKFYPFFADTVKPIDIRGFEIGKTQVTNAQFLEFVKANPKWRKSKVKKIFAEKSYLNHWESDLELGSSVNPDAPVVLVSWFAANAYCKWKGGRLADISEWEYVASASEDKYNAYKDEKFKDKLLKLYERLPKLPLPRTASVFQNKYGVYDMHGLVWEWTRDFNSVIVSADSRTKTNEDGKLFCAAGNIGNVDPSNYSAYVRYSIWSSLQAKFCLRNVGFRCLIEK